MNELPQFIITGLKSIHNLTNNIDFKKTTEDYIQATSNIIKSLDIKPISSILEELDEQSLNKENIFKCIQNALKIVRYVQTNC